MLLLKIWIIILCWNQTIYKNILIICEVYIGNIPQILMFVLLAEKDVWVYKSSKKSKSQVVPVQREQNRTVNFKLNYLKQLCQSCFCHFNKSERENRLQI